LNKKGSKLRKIIRKGKLRRKNIKEHECMVHQDALQKKKEEEAKRLVEEEESKRLVDEAQAKKLVDEAEEK
jgi:hypothetical protein